ncbi:MAG TPA: hypothetical protein PKD19_02590 [Candidatus Saccharibacteria bacterium]|nr:hypothetical protein [Candidatus Saccharibacteria bacterium]HMR38523.1 hypothetical protein [Candidatus Saccharibacteria bacterium]
MAIIQMKQKKKQPVNKKLLAIIAIAVVVLLAAVGGFLWWRHEQLREVNADKLNDINFVESSQEDQAKAVKDATGMTVDELRNKTPEKSGLVYFPEYYAAGRALTASDDAKQALPYYEKADDLMTEYTKKDTVESGFYKEYMVAAGDAGEYAKAKELAKKALEVIRLDDTLDEMGKERESSRIEFYIEQIETLEGAKG